MSEHGTNLSRVLGRVLEGEALSAEEMGSVFREVVEGLADPMRLAAFLGALRVRGETPTEIAGAAQALRDAALAFPCPDYLYGDTCGTGGDGLRTVNVSTASAFVCAALGVPVAKHGNRSVSSQCGSADVLEACGVALDIAPETARACLDETGVCFLMAPKYHSGLRHAGPVRRALAARTIFNILGPLVNPTRPAWQVMGVFDPSLCRPAAETLALLGTTSALVVHGDGLDEIALHGPTKAALLRDGAVEELTIEVGDAGLAPVPLEALRGGPPEVNATWLRALLGGRGELAHRQAVAINAGALLLVAGRVESLREGTAQALELLGTDAALGRLEQMVTLSQRATA